MKTRLPLSSGLLALVGGLIVVCLPIFGLDLFTAQQIELVAIFTLVVVGLNLSFGFAGELSLSQVAMFAVGAYVAGYMATHQLNDLALTLPAAMASAACVGLVAGLPGLRMGGWALAMVSFFLVLLIPDVVTVFQDQTGGLAGMPGIPEPRVLGMRLDQTAFYILVAGSAVLFTAGLRNLVISRHGWALRVLRESPILAASLGIPVFRLKLLAYVVGGIPAGLAGAFFAYLNGIVAPGSFGFDAAIGLLAASIIGGRESIYGAIFGAAFTQILPLRFTAFQTYALALYGGLLVLGGIFLSEGVAGWGRRLIPIRSPFHVGNRTLATRPVTADRLPGEPLTVAGVSRRFGGINALSEVSLTAKPGQITALIGPNGSGKTTLLNVVSGHVRLQAGEIRVGKIRTDHRSPHWLARMGISRTFQTPLIPRSLTVLETVAVARYERPYLGMLSAIFRLPRLKQAVREDMETAYGSLQLVGLHEQCDKVATSLPLGARRLVEVARALATRPSVILLDEPASGLHDDEVAELGRMLHEVRDAGCTVVLVEHNFEFVRKVADVLFVLAAGRIIASGSGDEVAENPEVIDVYLGRPLAASTVRPVGSRP